MDIINRLKLFISYSHEDENYVKEFTKHLSPFKNNGSLEAWYDRKIIAGQDFQDSIDNNLKYADIICLCISANFLSSPACLREKIKAYELRRSNGVHVVPIILSACGWLDDKEIAKTLALPTDGKPISSFQDHNDGWQKVYDGLKIIIENETKIRQGKTSNNFHIFLNNTELISNAHSKKTEVYLNDIFIYPDLEKCDDLGEYGKKINSKSMIDNFSNCSKILIAGEDQSGKTTLCKKIFIELRRKNLFPVYLCYKNNPHQENTEHAISRAFKEQYEEILIEDLDKNKIVPIIDDFHCTKKKESHIGELSLYCHQILIVDDIFSLNFKDENIARSFTQYKIKELSPTLRNELIEKWVSLGNEAEINRNHIYKGIDSKTELVDSTLGKLLSSGIMPAYPFFILSIISTYETFAKPLDQEITSQGYCYQALIYMYLRKQGVKNEEIDTYINFLTVLAHYFFSEKKHELSENEFNIFMKKYLEKYNLPINKDTLLKNLQKTKLLFLNSCNNYYFYYSYLYFFFVAKYLAEHLDDNKKVVSHIINNLQKDENAYIAIFMSHHSKNPYILDEIVQNAMGSFDKYNPATLTKKDLAFFDDKLDEIIKAVLPAVSMSPDAARRKKLEIQDSMEEEKSVVDKDIEADDEKTENIVAKDLRRSIKTVEVMGRIIKNRAGSLEKSKLEFIFEEGMYVHLRILTFFFDIIKDESRQNELVDYIESKLLQTVEDKTHTPTQNQLKKTARNIFWNLNFLTVYGLLDKIITSLGSDNLNTVIHNVCDKNGSPAAFLVKHGTLMWYDKNMQIDKISERIKHDGFSETAKRIMRFMIVNHCTLHHVDYKDRQKIEAKLGISAIRLLKQGSSHE